MSYNIETIAGVAEREPTDAELAEIGLEPGDFYFISQDELDALLVEEYPRD